MEKTQVVIIGGGATGTGILWDLTLRGVQAILLEKADLANGATGRCHGLLHSGARYAVKDPDAASECIRENTILRKVARACVHETGGLFVHLPQDDAAFVPQWVEGCAKAGIPTERLSRDEVLALEPNLPSDIVEAYTCPDANVAPQVSGQITEIRVVDNQSVHQGDVLYVIDPFDFQVALDTQKIQLRQRAADLQVKKLQSRCNTRVLRSQ